jgi:photosynthetic reaction center cytochrome c subunit
MTKLLALVVLTTLLVGVPCMLRAQSSPAQAASDSAPKTTDQVFKNIQVLKAIPSDQLIPAMQFITSSLGVECDFCHVQNAYDKDEKKPKQTARKMMEMMFAINKQNFDGRREVTCYSCHRGSAHPVGIPVISSEKRAEEPMEAHEAVPANLPTADQLIDKYVQALGGAQAIQKISSRVEKGTVKLDGRKFPVAIFNLAPDKRASIMQLSNGDSLTIYDGHAGWLAVPSRPVHDMSGADLDAARLDADLHLPIEMKQIFSDFNVEHPEKVGDHEAYVVSGLREGQPPMKFYFDEKSGLLIRIVRYAESPLGRNPTQIDYDDYRDIDGVKTPFQWTIARPGGRFTIRIEQAQQNVPIDERKFGRPASTTPEQKPPSQ